SVPAVPGGGFTLGEGWSFSYTGQIIDQSSQNKAYVVDDDGLMKLYTRTNANSPWIPPTGVHDQLTYDANNTTTPWTVTRKNQWRRLYESGGYLLYEYDANQVQYFYPPDPALTGLSVTIIRLQDHRIKNIYDAAGRGFHFEYFDNESPKRVRVTGLSDEAW